MNISTYYHIPARELDFANINLTKDNKLFIDPVRIRNGTTALHKKCYSKIEIFVNNLIKLAQNKEYKKFFRLISFLNLFRTSVS